MRGYFVPPFSLGLLLPGAWAGLPDGNWPGGKLALLWAIRSSSFSIWKRALGLASWRFSMLQLLTGKGGRAEKQSPTHGATQVGSGRSHASGWWLDIEGGI